MVSLKVLATVAQGDLDGAHAVIAEAARRIDPPALFAFLANYQDLYWVLDDEQQREVLALPPAAFDGDRASWGMVRTELYHLRGDRRRALAYADSARLAFEEQSRAAPEDGQRHVLLGLTLAYLGRRADALREGRRGMELMPISRDGYFGPYIQLQMVRIYLLLGEREEALDQLEPLLRLPFYISLVGFGSIPPSIRCATTRGSGSCWRGPRESMPRSGILPLQVDARARPGRGARLLPSLPFQPALRST